VPLTGTFQYRVEVLQGMRNKAELLAVQKMLDKRAATLLPITECWRRLKIDPPVRVMPIQN
jgi:hypothetical protein